jgi:hypothetical protein
MSIFESAAYYIKETVYDLLFVGVIRGRWRLTSPSTYNSIAYRTGKRFGRKQGKLIAWKFT